MGVDVLGLLHTCPRGCPGVRSLIVAESGHEVACDHRQARGRKGAVPLVQGASRDLGSTLLAQWFEQRHAQPLVRHLGEDQEARRCGRAKEGAASLGRGSGFLGQVASPHGCQQVVWPSAGQLLQHLDEHVLARLRRSHQEEALGVVRMGENRASSPSSRFDCSLRARRSKLDEIDGLDGLVGPPRAGGRGPAGHG